MLKRCFWITLIVLSALGFSRSLAYAVGITIPLNSQLKVNAGILNVPGDVANSGTVVLTSGKINLIGNWTNSGTLTSGIGTVEFSAAAGTQTVNSGGAAANQAFYHLIHSGAGGLELLTNPIKLNGNFTNSAGNFDTKGLSMNVGGNWSNTGTFIHSSGLVTFDATTGTLAIDAFPANGAFYDLTFSATGRTYTLNSALTVERDISITAGTLDAGANDIIVSRNWTVNNTNGGFISSATVTFNGASTQAVSTGGTNATHDFQNLTHSGDGKLQLNASYDLAVNAALVQSGAGDFDTQARAVNAGSMDVSNGTFNVDARAGTWIVGGNVSISSSALTATSGSFSIGGSFSNSGTFNSNNGTITFNATSGSPTIDAPVASGVFNNLIFNDAGNNITFTLNSPIKLNNSLTITGGTLNANSQDITLGGSWDNNDLFTPGNSVVTFDAAATGKTIEAGASSFYKVVLNSASGGWTIQTDNLTATNDFILSAASAFALSSGRTLEVQGQFTNSVGGTATTWAGSILYLNASGSQTINAKTDSGDDYETLRVGASQAARMWNSQASTYTIDSGGSLYSMDHAGVNGELYIWGAYVVPEDSTDYWAYATDFDTVSLSGSERQAKVYLADTASVACGSGETLRIIGADGYPTLIDRQGGSGSYAITVDNGFLRAQYYSIRHINGNGLNLLGASMVVSNLDYGSFDNSEGSGATDAFITVAGDVITNNPAFLLTGCVFNNTNGNANFNVRATGTSTSFWNFSGTSGSFDGESFNSDPGGNPGYLVWDDSAGAPINIAGTAFDDDNEIQTTNSARVSLAVNDQYQNYVTTDVSNGTFSFSGISVKTGDSLTLYFDNEAFKGALVTVAGTGNITGLKMYKNHVVVRTEPVGALSINQMALYDKNNDNDINFDAEDVAVDTLVIDDGSELFIPSGKEFQPLGNLQDGTAGVWDIDNRGTFTCVATEQIRVSGSWYNGAAATFTCANSTVRFDGSSGTPQIDPQGDDFYNLVIASTMAYTLAGNLVAENNLQASSGSLTTASYGITVGGSLIVDGGTLNLSSNALAVAGDVSLSSGVLIAPTSGVSFTVGGNWENTGVTFTSGTGKVAFNKASGTQTLNAGGTGNDNRDFNNIDKTGGGSLQLIGSGLEADGELLVSSSTTFDLNGQDLNLGTLNNSGTVQMLGSETTVAITTMDTVKGTVTYVGDGDETPEVFTVKNFGALDYYDLVINDINTTKDTFRTAADMGINHQLQVLNGEMDISFNGNNLIIENDLIINGGTLTATNGNIEVVGNMTLTSGILTAPANGQYFRIAGNTDLSGTFNNSSGEITFNAISGSPTINSGGNDLYDLLFDDSTSGITFTLSSDITVNNLVITSGVLNTGSDRAITVSGNWSNAGSFISNNSLVTFNKADGTQTINAGGTGNASKDFQSLTKTGGGTLQLSLSGLEVDGTLSVSSGTILDLNGQNLTAGALDNSDTVELHGNEAVNVTANDTDSGLVRYVGDGDAVEDTFNIAGFASSQYFNLTINDTAATKDIFQTTEDVSVAGDLSINGGTLTATSHNVAVLGSVNIASGTFNAPGSGKILTIGDDFSVAGTFTPGTGTVLFNDNSKETTLDAPGGGLNFNNFTCSTASKILHFTQSDTFTVAGVFTLNGQASGTRIYLNSTGGAGTTWNLILNGSHAISFVDVQGSKASGTVTFPINPADSVDSGNNSNWFPVAISTDSNMLRLGAERHTFYDGTFYWIFYIDTDGNVVYKKSADGGQWGSAVTVSSGDYKSLGIWEDNTYVWCSYADASNSYERNITISTGALGTERTLTSAAQNHSQPIKSVSGYIHRKAEQAMGGQWKVYNYTGNIGATAQLNVDITPVAYDTNRAFILAPSGSMSVGSGSGGALQNATEVLTRAKFNSNSQVQLNRGAATGDSAYSFYVIEEATGGDIYVASGSNAFTANTDADLTIPLTGITDYTKCVVFLTVSSNSAANTRYHQAHVRGYVDSSNNLQLLRTAGNCIATVDWFVVEFKGEWTVQQAAADFSLTTGIDGSPQTQTISEVDLNRSFVFMNWSVSATGIGVDTAKVELTNATTLSFSRLTAATGTCLCRWVVVSHPNLVVQRGTDAALAADFNEDQAITAVDTTRAFPVTFNDCAGTTQAENPVPYWRAWLSNASTLYWDRSFRGTTQRAANFKWQVIEFPRGFYWQRSTNIDDDSAWNAEEEIAEDTDGTGHCALLPLTAGNVMALYNDYDTGTYNLRYKIYNGSAWGSEGTIVTDCQDTAVSSTWATAHYFSAVSDDVGYAYLIYQDTSGNIKYSTYDGSNWSSAVAVSDNAGCSHPTLTYDATYETLYAFWLEGTDLKYKRYLRSWAAPATTLRTYLVSPTCLGSAYQDTTAIGILWQQGATAPYSGGYEVLQIVPTIVDLVDFYAIGYSTKVKLSWRTASEINNAGFNIYRSLSPASDYIKVNASLISGLGTSTVGSEYSYEDITVASGSTYYYVLESVELNGKSRKFGPVIAHPGVDTDSDGMSDDYEYYYGLSPAVNDAVLDPDNDGLTNLQEYQNNTDPYSAAQESLSWEAGESGTAGITIISSTDSEMVLELVTNKFDTATKVEGADTYHRISLPDYAHAYTEEVGKPQVPLKSILLTMSGKKPLAVTVLDYDREELSGYNIYPVPRRVLVTQGATVFLARQFYKNSLTYSTDALYPQKLAEVDYSSYLRGQEVAKLNFYPFQTNPVTGAVDLYNRLRIKLSTQPSSATSTLASGSGIAQGVNNAFKLQVKEDGIYRVSYQDLVNVGAAVSSLNPKNFRIYNKGVQLPIYVQGEDDGIFAEGDYLEFYGQKESTRYTYTGVYWLTTDEGPGLRMETKTAVAGTTPGSFLYTHHFERNENYWMEVAVDDPWFFSPQVSAGATQSFTTSLVDVVNSPQDCLFSASFKAYRWGDSDVTHHLRVYLNNHIIGDVSWLNDESYNAQVAFPSYWLKEGNNIIKLTSIVDGANDTNGLALADWFDISYWRNFVARDDYLEFTPSAIGEHTYSLTGFTDSAIRGYDITDHDSVKKISSLSILPDGPTYKVTFNDSSLAASKYAILEDAGAKTPQAIIADIPSSLRSASNQADYIIITCDSLADAIAPLAAYRTSTGLSVKTAKLTDVYDEFNYGISSPAAIKSFLSYAYNQWKKPAPVYVLLVGDATYDFRDDEEYGFTDYMPTYFFNNQDFGETAWDDWFACFDSEADIFPEMLIGRFPAKSAAEVTAMVNKTIAYESVSLDESWVKNALFIADDAGGFESVCDTLSDTMVDKYLRLKFYLSSYSNSEDCKQDLISAFNRGALLVNYSGHGGIQSWAEEELFTNDDIGSLTNKDKYPFVIDLNCVNGYFVYPMFFECLAEELIRAQDKGAVAVLAPSGMSLTSQQAILAEGLYDSLFKQQERILGSAVAKGKLYLFQEAADTTGEALKQFNLFGDPALVLRKEALVAAAATAPSAYTPVKGLSSLYALNIGLDAAKLYPSLLFDPEIEGRLEKEPKKLPKGAKTKVKELGSVERVSVIDRLAGGSAKTKTNLKPQEALSYTDNKIVRLGPVPKLRTEAPRGMTIAERKAALKSPVKPKVPGRSLKPAGFWERFREAVSAMFGGLFRRK
ncbi:MAG: C25 family cysteine peptidase [Candidatus Omnitrophica bacterium]|nr:C25 family cysteine peptidase [Candidatus Omnitrophota bacterium]